MYSLNNSPQMCSWSSVCFKQVFLCRCIFFLCRLCLSYRLFLKYPLLTYPFIEILGSGQCYVLETSLIRLIRYNWKLKNLPLFILQHFTINLRILAQCFPNTVKSFLKDIVIWFVECRPYLSIFPIFHRFECGLFLRCWYPAEPHDHWSLPCKSCPPCLSMDTYIYTT